MLCSVLFRNLTWDWPSCACTPCTCLLRTGFVHERVTRIPGPGPGLQLSSPPNWFLYSLVPQARPGLIAHTKVLCVASRAPSLHMAPEETNTRGPVEGRPYICNMNTAGPVLRHCIMMPAREPQVIWALGGAVNAPHFNARSLTSVDSLWPLVDPKFKRSNESTDTRPFIHLCHFFLLLVP